MFALNYLQFQTRTTRDMGVVTILYYIGIVSISIHPESKKITETALQPKNWLKRFDFMLFSFKCRKSAWSNIA